MTSLGLVLHEAGTISGEGTFQEIHNIITNRGWVFADLAKKIASGDEDDEERTGRCRKAGICQLSRRYPSLYGEFSADVRDGGRPGLLS